MKIYLDKINEGVASLKCNKCDSQIDNYHVLSMMVNDLEKQKQAILKEHGEQTDLSQYVGEYSINCSKCQENDDFEMPEEVKASIRQWQQHFAKNGGTK